MNGTNDQNLGPYRLLRVVGYKISLSVCQWGSGQKKIWAKFPCFFACSMFHSAQEGNTKVVPIRNPTRCAQNPQKWIYMLGWIINRKVDLFFYPLYAPGGPKGWTVHFGHFSEFGASIGNFFFTLWVWKKLSDQKKIENGGFCSVRKFLIFFQNFWFFMVFGRFHPQKGNSQ